MEEWPTTKEAYEKLGEIGRGATSIVYRAMCSNGIECAIKVFNTDDIPMHAVDRIRAEINMMLKCDHPNILKIYATFLTGDELWMVVPLHAGGSLKAIMDRHFPEGLSEPVVWAILKQVLDALDYLHNTKDNIHRDVKAGNIFMSLDGTVVLGDFGHAAELIEAGDKRSVRDTFAGTPCWMAPEVLQQLSGYKASADIWSLGITVMELLKGKAPWSDLKPMKIVVTVLKSPAPDLEGKEDKAKYSKNMRNFVKGCLNKNPDKRVKVEKLRSLKCVSNAGDATFLAEQLTSRITPVGEVETPKKEELGVDQLADLVAQMDGEVTGQSPQEKQEPSTADGGSDATTPVNSSPKSESPVRGNADVDGEDGNGGGGGGGGGLAGLNIDALMSDVDAQNLIKS